MAKEQQEKSLKIQLEAEKIKSFDDLKNQLFANVSHELRTPLTMIMGTIEKNLSQENNEDWLLLRRHSESLLRLINQILDLSKLESGQFQLHPTPGDIISFFRNGLTMFSSLTYAKNIKLRQNISTDIPILNFDQDAIQKILFNLVSNAVKFSKIDGEVKIDVRYYKGVLRFNIKDQGVGIPPDSLNKIFDRYYQVGKKSNSGTGIGLALTKELIDLHGGSIDVQSVYGEGSTFIVKLPLAKSKGSIVSNKISQEKEYYVPTNLTKIKDQEASFQNSILIIEDNHELAALIESILQAEYNITTSYDGVEGIRVAKETLPDLIISDIMMPGINGIDLCQKLKGDELTSHIPIILLTARADFDSKIEGLQSGADDYILKPFQTKELISRSKNLIEQRKILKTKFSRTILLDPQDIVITNVEEVFLKKLISIVNQRLGENNFNVTTLCHSLGMSRMQLHRKITALTGMSTTAFIRHQRMLVAGKLLINGHRVSQVAYQVGFSSLSYFSTTFHKHYGINPSEYRDRNMKSQKV